MSGLSDAIKNRKPPATPWTITAQDVGGAKALQFKSKTASALIQPGGTVDGYTLLFIGDKWALMAAQDQLFTIAF